MSRELEDNTENSSLQDNEEEIGEPAATPLLNYTSDQEEQALRPIGSNVQVAVPRNAVVDEDSENYSPINRETTFSTEINRLLDLIISDYFNELGGNSILAQNGFRINENFEGVLVVGDDIIVVDKGLGESS